MSFWAEKGPRAPVTRAKMEEEGVGMAREADCPAVRQWFFRNARDGRGICRLGGKGADAQAPGGCFFCGNRVWGEGKGKASCPRRA